MKAPPAWFRRLMSALSVLAPPIATTIALRLFWSLGALAPVRPADRATHERAERGAMTIRGTTITTYRWGDPAHPVVILSHGWRSRASRFSVLVDALLARGFAVAAFDAPGNGDSAGARTVIYDYVAAIRGLAGHERVAAVVGHSFGAIAAAMAVRRGVRASAVVTVAGAHDFDFIVDHFVAQIGLRGAAARALRRRTERVADEPGIRELVDGDLWSDIVARFDDPEQRVLVIHDEADASVPVSQSRAIADGQGDAARLVITAGLGHSALLADPAVIGLIVEEIVAAQEQQRRDA